MKIETFKTFFYRLTRRLLFKSRERYRFVCGTLEVLDLSLLRITRILRTIYLRGVD